MNSHGARGPRGHYLTVECSAVVGVEHSPGGDQGSMVSARVGEPPVAGATAPARALNLSSVDKVRRSPSLSDGPYAATPTRPQGSTELGTSAAESVAALLDDLAPMCDMESLDGRPCDQVAEFICWFDCDCGEATSDEAVLLCADDHATALGWPFYWQSYGDDHDDHAAVLTRSERINRKPH